MIVNRYSHLTLEERARLAEGAHDLAEQHARHLDLNFCDVEAAHPGPEQITREFGRP